MNQTYIDPDGDVMCYDGTILCTRETRERLVREGSEAPSTPSVSPASEPGKRVAIVGNSDEGRGAGEATAPENGMCECCRKRVATVRGLCDHCKEDYQQLLEAEENEARDADDDRSWGPKPDESGSVPDEYPDNGTVPLPYTCTGTKDFPTWDADSFIANLQREHDEQVRAGKR